MTAGRFITLEGGEGVGKSTQAGRLATALRERDIDVVVTREPGGTAGAELIRELVMTGRADRWNMQSEAMLFAAARADHVDKIIGPALQLGAWIVCDRFIDSSRAYQGGAGGLCDDDIMALHRVGSGGIMPDRTLLLHLPTDVAASRIQARSNGIGDRIADRDNGYHARLAVAFEQIARAEPDRVRLVDATGAAEIVTDRLFAAIGDLL